MGRKRGHGGEKRKRKKNEKKNTAEGGDAGRVIPGGAQIFSAPPSRFHPVRLLSSLTTQPPTLRSFLFSMIRAVRARTSCIPNSCLVVALLTSWLREKNKNWILWRKPKLNSTYTYTYYNEYFINKLFLMSIKTSDRHKDTLLILRSLTEFFHVTVIFMNIYSHRKYVK